MLKRPEKDVPAATSRRRIDTVIGRTGAVFKFVHFQDRSWLKSIEGWFVVIPSKRFEIVERSKSQDDELSNERHDSVVCGMVFAAPLSLLVLISDGEASVPGVLYDTPAREAQDMGLRRITPACFADSGTNVYLEWFNFDLDAASFMTIYDGDNTAPVLGYSGAGSFKTSIHRLQQFLWLLTIKFVSSANPDTGGFWGHHWLWSTVMLIRGQSIGQSFVCLSWRNGWI